MTTRAELIEQLLKLERSDNLTTIRYTPTYSPGAIKDWSRFSDTYCDFVAAVSLQVDGEMFFVDIYENPDTGMCMTVSRGQPHADSSVEFWTIDDNPACNELPAIFPDLEWEGGYEC